LKERSGNGSAGPKSLSGDLNAFKSFDHAYHQIICELIIKQKKSTDLVLKNGSVGKIFVDGGFCRNEIFMKLLAAIYHDKKIYAASVAQASALGAALAIHKHWNGKPIPGNLIEVKYYPQDSA
jgi:sugar (pentulose or hexulose) kinase